MHPPLLGVGLALYGLMSIIDHCAMAVARLLAAVALLSPSTHVSTTGSVVVERAVQGLFPRRIRVRCEPEPVGLYTVRQTMWS